MDYLPLPGTPVEEIDTPAIIVDLDIAEANIAAMSAFASENGVSLRPHMKTGKSPFWALKQIEAKYGKEGIPLNEATVSDIVGVARERGVDVPASLS